MSVTQNLTETVVIDDSSDEESEDNSALKLGIKAEAMGALEEKAKSNGLKSIVCSLLITDVTLTQKQEKYRGKLFGYSEGIPLQESDKMASNAIIMMVISLEENWKIPIALYFTHQPHTKYFAAVIENALEELHKIGIHIVSVTLDCLSPHLNFLLALELGAKIDLLQPTKPIKSYFKHPRNKSMVFIFYDLDIILVALKKYLSTEGLICHKNNLIHYSLCADVKKIQETDLGNYKLLDMYDWIIIRKRLTYEPETIGKTTADAMEYLCDLGHPDYIGSGATILFLKVYELISQLSKVGEEDGCYPHLSLGNATEWEPLVNNILKYTKNLRSLNKGIPNHLCPLKKYITGINVFFTSINEMYSHCVNVQQGNILHYLLPSRFSLKHIHDSFFEAGRERGSEDHPTALSIFKKMESLANSLHPIKSQL